MTEPNQSNTEDTEIHLSVQGNYFVVEKSMVEALDWILSKIISSDIPWRKTSDKGQIYLDVDPTSFRVILGILKGTFDISQDAGMLSRSDLALLKTTARYLMLDDILEEVCAFENGIVEEYNETIRKKDEEILKIKQKNVMLQLKANVYDRIQAKVRTLNISLFRCESSCISYDANAHRRNSRCGAKSIIIGSMDPSDDPAAVSGRFRTSIISQMR